ncbi:MAG: LysR family transcriptional regulator [Sphaerochaetaceae bacterium]|jgi:molybdate transport system regulatory protein|nr:LysR family transcriptional regulator [Sphaerochaetaceae bacterium]NLY07226.1 LysR family transcriptional regulator [Spirochaetales bacterium]
MEMKNRIYLLDGGRKFMGVGVFWLLKEIGKCGSLRQAALSLDISYSKAFRMIFDLENALGMKVVDRHRGGMSRDGAVLTEFGEKFILLYEDFQNRSSDLVTEVFMEFSKGLDNLKSICGVKLDREVSDEGKKV